MDTRGKGDTAFRSESDARETVFARICLQRGWVTREEIATCLQRRASPGGTLGDLLVAGGHLSRPQVEVVGEEVTRLLQDRVYSTVQHEATLGDLLIRTRQVTREQVYEVLAIQSECIRQRMLVPLFGELLIEKGYLSRDGLEQALLVQRRMKRLRCERCGTVYMLPELETGRTYLCRKCAIPLSPLSPGADPRVAIPEEVQRAAANPKNVVGRYVAVKELGRGGMGAVYKAWDGLLGRWVALKINMVGGGLEGRIRFRREAETAALLQHPNIVPIYDVGQAGDRHFIAMKYIEGRSLAERKMPIQQACELMIQVAAGIELAHTKDIVHRDLKPSNIMIDPTGRAYIMDFGLAKNLLESFNITAPGTVMGSPSYMSPEQAAGQLSKVDRRSDVYSLGAVLYVLLAGQPPFKAETAILTVKQVLDQPVPPPAGLNPEIPADLEQIILRTLSKDRAQRYASAGEFARALEQHLAKKPIDPTPATTTPAPVKKKGFFKRFGF